MDVKPGHCWCCERVLPKHVVHCGHCPMAEYCSTSCRDRDTTRHGSVECQLFKPKMCRTCGKAVGDMSECSRCNGAWYCSKRCQQQDWKDHKPLCKEVKAAIRVMSQQLGSRNSVLALTMKRVGDPPHYFGNTMAKDFLQLEGNEWSEEGGLEKELGRDYHVLSVGCGDLRNTVLTAGSLPEGYQGKLHVTLNDFDPFVMARNVLFLFMLVRFADTDGIVSSLTTIWYSLRISKREYDLIKTSLDELIQMSAQDLHDATKGLVSVLDADLRYMRQVWEGWQSLECQRGKHAFLNLKKQRKELLQNAQNTVSAYLNHLSSKERKWLKRWLDHGLFLPSENTERDTLLDNPTLTGRAACKFQPESEMEAPENCTFVYCIKAASFPFRAWDYLRVRDRSSASLSSPMAMYHSYVTNLLQKVQDLILQGRLQLRLSLANCLDFPNYHQDLQIPNYDRIFTSNIADLLGFARLLKTFKPLLNAGNTSSVIVTETMNWFLNTPLADITDITTVSDVSEYTNCFLTYCNDRGKNTVVPQLPGDFPGVKEYYNNTPQFLQFLRADIMGGGHEIKALKRVPRFSSVMKYHGMQMRDFRKGLNKLVPFKYRVNARTLSMVSGYDRAVEWSLCESDS